MFVANYMWDIYIFRFGVLKALVEDGYEVIAVAPDDGRVNLEKLIPGIKTIPITLNKRGINPIEDIKLINELYRIYKTEKPDLIFHYTIKPRNIVLVPVCLSLCVCCTFYELIRCMCERVCECATPLNPFLVHDSSA